MHGSSFPLRVLRALRGRSSLGNPSMALYREYDKAGLDAQYFLRGRVPEHPEYFRRWAEDSAAVRRARPCRLDIPYDVETLDLFPAEKKHAPCLLFIHGGYWQALDKSDFSFLVPAFQDV